MIGDGGQSGFDAADPEFRFHTFFDASPDVNFSGGDIADWNWIADPIFGTGDAVLRADHHRPDGVADDVRGTANGLRTKTHGLGTMTLAEAQQHCNEWTGDFAGRRAATGPRSADRRRLNCRGSAATAPVGAVTAVERTTADTSTAWAATTTGRVFISKNVDADPAGAVTWTRLDTTGRERSEPVRQRASTSTRRTATAPGSRTSGFDASTRRRRRGTCSR